MHLGQFNQVKEAIQSEQALYLRTVEVAGKASEDWE